MYLPRSRTCVALGLSGIASALALGAGCRTPTQIVVEVRSELCARVHSTDVTVARNETALAAKGVSDASRSGCVSAPQVGTVVLVPDGSDSDEVVLRVVTALDKPASTCREGDDGCIVARRRARFVPGEIVNVVVVMGLTCQRVVCGAGESCDPLTGRCGVLAGGAGGSPDAGSPDAAGADSAAPACNAAGCVFECNTKTDCAPPPCVPDLPCEINCNAPGACDQVNCGDASSCRVNCKVDGACGGRDAVRCGRARSCTVDCQTQRACDAPIRCSCEGACAVTCSAPRCDRQDVHCCNDDCDMPEDFECKGECD